MFTVTPYLYSTAILLAVEMAVANPGIRIAVSSVFMLIALFFVYRSFYGMRITSNQSR